MPFASEVMPFRRVSGPLAEEQIATTCPQCLSWQRLDEAAIEESPLATTYICKQRCGPILIVSPPALSPSPGSGHEAGPWMLRNPSDLFVHSTIADAGAVGYPALLYPASPQALAPS